MIKRDQPRANVFIVRLLDEKNKIIERSFCASTAQDRDEWCEAFEQVKSAHERSLLEPTDLANFVDLSLAKSGKTKDDFAKVKKLGAGAFGNVFLVQDDRKQYYAMKEPRV